MSGRIMLDDPKPREEEAPPPPPPERPQEPPQPPEPQPGPLPGKEAETPPAAATEAVEGTSEPEAPPPLPPDLQKRIDRLTWEKYDAQRRATEAENQMRAWAEQQRRAQMPPGADDAEGRALQRFRAEQAERDFNAACNRTFEQGQRDYPDFGEAVRALQAVGYGNRPDALAAITAMPDGHHVYRALAQDLDNAARVLALPPMQMAMELARMAHTRDAAPAPTVNGASLQPATATPPAVPVTRAPAPLRPVGGNSARPEKPLDQLSMAEFIRRRDRDTSGSSRIRN